MILVTPTEVKTGHNGHMNPSNLFNFAYDNGLRFSYDAKNALVFLETPLELEASIMGFLTNNGYNYTRLMGYVAFLLVY